MNKILSILTALTLLLTFSTSAFAAELNTEQQSSSFQISLEEVLQMADPADIICQNGVTTIPVTMDINKEVYTEIVIKIDGLNRASAKSFSMEGWFRLTSNKEIVSVYGLDGTFEYNGKTSTPTGSSGYHNSAYSGWSGTYNLNNQKNDDGSAVITGDYKLYKNGKYNNSASCSAKCTKSGQISFSGNYDESSII